jgi:transposase-like protein
MASVAMANGINAKLLRRWVLTASAVSRREVQIAATSTPGTALTRQYRSSPSLRQSHQHEAV